MDGLSCSVSTLKLPPLHQTPREFHHYRAYTQLPPHPPLLSPTTKPNISKKTTSSTVKPLTPFSSSSSLSSSTINSSPPQFHRKPATGYAAALLDIAQCKSSLHAVQKDVRKLSKVIYNEGIRAWMNDPLVGENEKGDLVKEVARRWKLDKYLVRLVKMLVEKNKLGMVGEVLEEFQKIYDELSFSSEDGRISV
ncbi:hypothetical protein SLE2022_030370 [Rubroshorea leprosula]